MAGFTLPQVNLQPGFNALAQGLQMGQEKRSQNALAAALPGALNNDPTALQQLFKASPEWGLKVQSYNNQRADAADTLKRAEAEKQRGQMQNDMVGAFASIWQMPPELRPAAFAQAQSALHKKYGIGEDEQYDEQTFKAHALQLAASSKEAADIFGRVGLLPPEPAKDQGLLNIAPGGSVFDPVTKKPVYQAPYKPEAPQRETWGIPTTVDGPNGPTLIRTSNLGGMQEVPGYAPKPNNQQAASAKNAQQKLQTIAMIKAQLEKVKAARKALGSGAFDAAGPLGGRVPTAAGENFDATVALLSPLFRQLTRVPGEGASSDYESRLLAAPLPSRKNWNDTTVDTQINGIDDLVNAMEGIYGQYAPNQTAPTPPPAPAQTLPQGWKITKVK